jgi:hypothetical protein
MATPASLLRYAFADYLAFQPGQIAELDALPGRLPVDEVYLGVRP